MENVPENNWTLNQISKVAGENCAKVVNLMKYYTNKVVKVVDKSTKSFKEGFAKEDVKNGEDDDVVPVELQTKEI